MADPQGRPSLSYLSGLASLPPHFGSEHSGSGLICVATARYLTPIRFVTTIQESASLAPESSSARSWNCSRQRSLPQNALIVCDVRKTNVRVRLNQGTGRFRLVATVDRHFNGGDFVPVAGWGTDPTPQKWSGQSPNLFNPYGDPTTMNCLGGLLLSALLGAGVELGTDTNQSKSDGATPSSLAGQPLNLADAFKSEAKPKSEVQKKPTPLKRRVLVFKASWCGTCVLLERELPDVRRKKLRVGTSRTDHFQLIDVDRYPDLMQKHRVALLPTVILLDGDRELARHNYLNAGQLADLYQKK